MHFDLGEEDKKVVTLALLLRDNLEQYELALWVEEKEAQKVEEMGTQ